MTEAGTHDSGETRGETSPGRFLLGAIGPIALVVSAGLGWLNIPASIFIGVIGLFALVARRALVFRAVGAIGVVAFVLITISSTRAGLELGQIFDIYAPGVWLLAIGGVLTLGVGFIQVRRPEAD